MMEKNQSDQNSTNYSFKLLKTTFFVIFFLISDSVSTKGAKKYECCPQNYSFAEFDIHFKKMN